MRSGGMNGMGGGGGAVIPAENIGVSWSVGRY